MRFILGIFVGAALMLGSAYLHDIGVVGFILDRIVAGIAVIVTRGTAAN